jgi:tetratricopeptide (TPR) repeat protein
LDDFVLFVGGMNVGMKYLQHKKLRPDDFPPEISFEITEDGYIRLYVWSEESPGKSAKISELKAGFEQLFEKEKKSVAYYLEKADELIAQKAYQDCISLLDLAMQEHEPVKAEAFIRKGNVLLEIKNFEEALDCFMKARVLGAPKQRLSDGIKEACKYLLRYSENKEQRSHWNRLLEDFS